jgi:DNA-binding GntR family transcriptional regulator
MSDVMTAVALRRTQSLTAIVHQEVERMILCDELKPGDRINREALAGKPGVSRGPVREALRAIEREDGASYYRLNLHFHDAILEFAEHQRAKQTYEFLIKETYLLRQSALSSPTRRRESNDEHTALVAALAAGDAETARRLAEQHGHGGKRGWLETRNQ